MNITLSTSKYLKSPVFSHFFGKMPQNLPYYKKIEVGKRLQYNIQIVENYKNHSFDDFCPKVTHSRGYFEVTLMQHVLRSKALNPKNHAF